MPPWLAPIIPIAFFGGGFVICLIGLARDAAAAVRAMAQPEPSVSPPAPVGDGADANHRPPGEAM